MLRLDYHIYGCTLMIMKTTGHFLLSHKHAALETPFFRIFRNEMSIWPVKSSLHTSRVDGDTVKVERFQSYKKLSHHSPISRPFPMRNRSSTSMASLQLNWIKKDAGSNIFQCAVSELSKKFWNPCWPCDRRDCSRESNQARQPACLMINHWMRWTWSSTGIHPAT